MRQFIILALCFAGCSIQSDVPILVEECANLVDDDLDGLMDCADPDCGGICPEICTDSIDNDGDGLIDCADEDCDASPQTTCMEVCDDGRDNDGDGSIDCMDQDCLFNALCPEICDDGEDNDGDGSVDCADEDCAGYECGEVCGDGIDNDGDGLVDCDDLDCNTPQCDEDCFDGRDNDGDGEVDCDDLDCNGTCPEICDDMVDNDGDTLIDCDDEDECGALCDTDEDGSIDVDFGGDDCDDENPEVYPGADEICDGFDNDCDSMTDLDDPSLDINSLIRYHADLDEDGYGDPAVFEWSCSPIPDMVDNMEDCDDGDPALNPDATEVCDLNVDNDCDGLRDDEDPDLDISTTPTWYIDEDRDGFGSEEPEGGVYTCLPPDYIGWAPNSDDCDDTDETMGPAGDWIPDADGDGYGLGEGIGVVDCEQPEPGLAPEWRGEDCDETDDTIHPNAEEICEDEIDQDCDGEDASCASWIYGADGSGYASSFYRVDILSGTTEYLSDPGVGYTGLTFDADGFAYGISSGGFLGTAGNVDRVDMFTGVIETVVTTGMGEAAITYALGQIYVCDQFTSMASFDILSLAREDYGFGYDILSGYGYALAADEFGQIYYVNEFTLASVDPFSGSIEHIAYLSPGLYCTGGGATFHEGDLYVSCDAGGGTGLYIVDTATGTAVDTGILIDSTLIDAIGSPTP